MTATDDLRAVRDGLPLPAGPATDTLLPAG
jgi:hypothetical protein